MERAAERIFLLSLISLSAICGLAITIKMIGFLNPTWNWAAFAAPGANPHYYLLRAALSLSYVLLSLYLARQVYTWFQERHLTEWWDPTNQGSDAPLSWQQVMLLTSNETLSDPIKHVSKIRLRVSLFHAGVASLGFSVFFSISILFFDFMLRARVPTIFSNGSVTENGPSSASIAQVLNVSGNLTAYLALLASAVTVFFTFSKLRAKVRADSRQEWIIQLRRKLSAVIAKLIKHDQAKQGDNEDTILLNMNKDRMELELMLNPSERDHRLLLFLIHGCIFKNPIEIADYKIVHEELSNIEFPHPAAEALRRELTTSPLALGRRISYILRLSHVVLKREWERVKHTR